MLRRGGRMAAHEAEWCSPNNRPRKIKKCNESPALGQKNQPWRNDQNVRPNMEQKGRPGYKHGPHERSRSRPKNQWVPTGNVYPIDATYKRPRDELHPPDAGKERVVTEGIPTSPNKYALLGSEDTTAPVENQAIPMTIPRTTLNDIVAAVVPPIIAGMQGMQGNVTLAKGAPFVNSEMCNGRKSRDPRLAREEEQRESNKEEGEPKENNRDERVAEENEEVHVIAIENEVDEMAATSGNTGGKKKNKKSSKAKTDGHSHGTSNEDEAVIENAEPGTPKGNEEVGDDIKDQDAEAAGRLSRSENRHEVPNKRKKSKTRSRSRTKKKEETPFHWEDGIEDDPGIAQ